MEVYIVDVHGKKNVVRVEETCEVDDFCNRIVPIVLNLGSIRGNFILPDGRRLEGKKTLKEEGVNNKGKLLVCIMYKQETSKTSFIIPFILEYICL